MIETISKKYQNSEHVNIVTNYLDAVTWLQTDRVLCNNLPSIDPSIYDNARFSWYGKNADGTESEDMVEVYQWFISSASEWDVEYLSNRFGLLFTYSDLLDCFVLCVTHYGTSWDYVYCEDNLKDATWGANRKAGELR